MRNGYRHLDLAKVYENQDEVGAALKKVIPSVVKREELFITSKLWNSGHSSRAVAEAELDSTLAELGLEYLDLYRECWFHLRINQPLNPRSHPLAGVVRPGRRSVPPAAGERCQARPRNLPCRHVEDHDRAQGHRQGKPLSQLNTRRSEPGGLTCCRSRTSACPTSRSSTSRGSSTPPVSFP